MAFLKELFGLIGMIFKFIFEYNTPEKKKQRLIERLNSLEKQFIQAVGDGDDDRAANLSMELDRVRREIRLSQ